ncbi:hypothetical protein [Ruminococcus sp.]|uniref:hypothetical protein n=1 Tax=Ruminococcus sp. TaxID=41978 RepID=UPI0025D190E4|nr:hypothetical protein [Ruminococcus sp.]
MNIQHYKLNLDLLKNTSTPILYSHQLDKKSRFIDVTLTANDAEVTLDSSMTAVLNATTNNVIVAESQNCTISDNVIVVELTDNVLSLPGVTKCEIILSDNGGAIITAQHFIVKVTEKAINDKSKFEPAGSNLATKKDVNSAIETASAKMIAKDSLLNTSTSINLTSLEDTEQTANGVTISVKNNKISLIGTSTSAVNFILKLKKSVTLERGKAYCLSLQNFNNIKNSGCVFYPASGQTATAISSSWLLSGVSAFKNAVATYTATTSAKVDSIRVSIAANRLVDNSCNLQLEQNNKRTAYSNPDLIKSNIKPELYQVPNYTMHYLYVSNDYNENTDGFGVTKFNSILSANDSISDNSYRNRYTIVVMAGTYTDMQDRYAGLSDVKLIGYRGVMMKDYVYYESENIYNPQATIIKWDGAIGFDKSTLKSEDIIKKCPFHLDLNVHTHIKGFTFDCKNIRYALHLESGGTGYATEWTVANCIFKWGGRADCVDYAGKTTVPALGCGHSFGEIGLIENCKIIPTDCTVGYQNHENADNSDFGLSIKTGSNITIRNCDFGGTEIQARTLKGEYSDTPNILTIDRCINISEVKKLYAAPATKCDWTVVENLNKGE